MLLAMGILGGVAAGIYILAGGGAPGADTVLVAFTFAASLGACILAGTSLMMGRGKEGAGRQSSASVLGRAALAVACLGVCVVLFTLAATAGDESFLLWVMLIAAAGLLVGAAEKLASRN
jgi:hypothetical protein